MHKAFQYSRRFYGRSSGPALMPWLHSAGSGRSYCCIKSHPHRKINIYVPKCSSLSDVLSLLCQKKCLEPHGVLSISSKSFNILFFYGHRFHNLFFQRRVRVVRCHLSEFIDDIHALDNLSECGILSVQMRRCFVHDEELRTGRIRSH